MELEINGKKYDLVFGLKFIRELDKVYTQKVEGMEFGIGVESAIMYLQMKNPTVLYDLIKAGTSHLKSKPSNIDIENALEEYAEADELYDMFDKFKEAMESSVFLKPKLKHIGQVTKEEEKKKEKPKAKK